MSDRRRCAMSAWVHRRSHMLCGFGDTGSGIRASTDTSGAVGAGLMRVPVTPGMTDGGGTHVAAGRGGKVGGSVPMTGAGITTNARSGGMTPTAVGMATTTVDSGTDAEQT